MNRLFMVIIGACAICASIGCAAPDCTEGDKASCTCSGGNYGVQTCRGGSFGACDCPSGGTSGPADGAGCSDPGTLVCGNGADGSDTYALYCSPDDEIYSAVFQCPPTQSCYPVKGDTSISCGSSDPTFRIYYALLGEPCAAEQSAACTFDQRQVLICQQGIWTLHETCSSSGACDHALPGTTWGSRTCPSSAPNGCIMCNTTGGTSSSCPGLAVGCASTTCNGVYCGADWTGHGVYCSPGETCSYESNQWHCCG